jgi:protein phosphatase
MLNYEGFSLLETNLFIIIKIADRRRTLVDKIKEMHIPNDARVIVISDIHGEIGLFKELLEKINFNNRDYLIINGDICEKGRNSKETVAYIMELASLNPRVQVIEGNCEALVGELLAENPLLIKYLMTRRYCLFNEWLADARFPLNEQSSIREVKEVLIEHFSQEIELLSSLPTAIETDDYIFVHAGLEDLENWKETDRDKAISIPSFLEKSHQADKFVVVGHWPVVNYSKDIPSDNPIIDREKKIISIDGGNRVKDKGQLNALIIQRKAGEDVFSHAYVDGLPACRVVKDSAETFDMKGAIFYPDYDIVPLEEDEHFTLCSQPGKDELLYVKNEYILREENGRYRVKSDVSCSLINVSEGDAVSVLDDSCSGYALIKKDGKIGWVRKEILPAVLLAD